MTRTPSPRSKAPEARLQAALVMGFAVTVALWAVAYVCRFPAVQAPAGPTVALLLAVLLLGGYVTGRLPGGGLPAGAGAGFVSGLLNLLVLGSVAVEKRPEGAPSPALWLPASVLACAALCALGAAAGARRPWGRAPRWPLLLCLVTLAATLLLLAAGGLVTSTEAGLAVPDWPTSFASNMFLLPLSRMAGPVYLEHAHRLLGFLVGLTTLALAVYLIAAREPLRVRMLGVGAAVLVAVQGVLGGQRVTTAEAGGGVGHATGAEETTLSLVLRTGHGIIAQVFLGVVVLLAVLTSRSWRGRSNRQHAATGPLLPVAAAVLLLVQLGLGAAARHLERAAPEDRPGVLELHALLALVVAGTLLVLGARLEHAPARQAALAGRALLVATVLQVILGVAAGAATTGPPSPLALEATLTTAHQLLGAVLLGLLAAILPWCLHRGSTPA